MAVYFIKQTNDIFKIGVSINPEKRLAEIQVGNPFELTIYKTIYHDEYKLLELLLHKKFIKRRIRGEWFNIYQKEIDELDITSILNDKIEINDNNNVKKRKYMKKNSLPIYVNNLLNDMFGFGITNINYEKVWDKNELNEILDKWIPIHKDKIKIYMRNDTNNDFISRANKLQAINSLLRKACNVTFKSINKKQKKYKFMNKL